MNFYWAIRQARDIVISVNSLGTWFFSKEYLYGQYGTSFRNYPVQNRGERGWLPTYVRTHLRCLRTLRSNLLPRSSLDPLTFALPSLWIKLSIWNLHYGKLAAGKLDVQEAKEIGKFSYRPVKKGKWKMLMHLYRYLIHAPVPPSISDPASWVCWTVWKE